MKQKIMIGLSGGVDSSVAAILLKNKGYHLEALFMKNWEEDDTDNNCSAEEDFNDASNVAEKLGIKLHNVNFSDYYWDEVFKDFLIEHKKGRTPNPDVLCNQKIKFKYFLEYALNLGADKIATGHYARIKKNSKYHLLTGIDTNKDQSYFLHLLNQQQLAKSIFPLGELKKSEVREIAKKYNLINAKKKDSTGICFIGEKNFQKFLNKYINDKPGNIVDDRGNVLKKHNGIHYFTIGQRKGLQIGGISGSENKPWFVADKNTKTNEVIVSQGDSPLLYHNIIITEKPHWISNEPPLLPLKLTAKIRYRQQSKSCLLKSFKNNKLKVMFDEPQRAVTPGQSIVFYHNEVCLGGGIIDKRL